MDTISSRESDTNYLPLAGVIAGVAALLLAVFAFVQIRSLKKEVDDLKGLGDRVGGIETQVSQATNAVQVANNAAQVANETRNSLMNVARDTNNSFKQVSDQLGELRTRLESRPAGPARTAGGNTTPGGNTATQTPPPTAGTDEYIVKSGDTGAKIAANAGVKLSDLMAVNPDVNWNRMHVGQKIKLPKK
ncbi:MAG: LysM peptidoglycan-binding domain-containing protein [Opitutaceae bacterium]|jgi:LysM repeat protein|nr:LysM peptidoglycan-binding domain-containing protein [Opitutaceae bacterium]